MNISIFKVGLIIITSVLLLAGCGKIIRVELAPGTPIVCDTTFNTPCGITDTQSVKIRVWGEGKCDSVGIKMGDGDTRLARLLLILVKPVQAYRLNLRIPIHSPGPAPRRYTLIPQQTVWAKHLKRYES